MSKYIDYEKLIAEIERRLEKYDPDYTSAGSELNDLLSFIPSLQQEQPDGLDEAAENYAHSLGYDEEKDKAEIAGAKEDFIAGAEWQKHQMEKEAIPFYEVLKAVPPTEDRNNVKLIILKNNE